mmetsp:Transcript_41332/g.64576  ORF Transcript_41332/g.64576 Transcript_41332/m.64576 type:complete len:209 (+) Transcript_41332:327-953(+)
MDRILCIPPWRLSKSSGVLPGDGFTGREARPRDLPFHGVLLLLHADVRAGGDRGDEGPGHHTQEPAALPRLAQAEQGECAHALPPEADRRQRGPALAGGHPLPALAFPGGDGHLQAAAAGEPGRPGPERVRGHVLLQAGLLRRLPRDPGRLHPGAPGQRGGHQPEGLQPLPPVQREGRGGRAEGADRPGAQPAVERPDPAQPGGVRRG